MADNLIFPIGFDYNKGLEVVEKQWAAQQAKLDKMFSANINLTISPKSIDNLEAVQARLKQIKLEPVTPETRNAIRTLVAELKNLEKILIKVDKLNAQRSRSASSASAQSALASQREAAAAANMARAAERNARTEEVRQRTAERSSIAQEQARQAVLRTERAELNLANARARGLSATQSQNNAYVTQSGLLNGLKQSMNAYISVLGMKRLADNIRNVTAEFELQRVALGAILQDKAKADELFNQVVQLAVKSPFQIKEMIGFTKQLAAYRINTEDLFDTTKRLADVSAGLGVEMGRLILAYGQVSAASVLRGQEVRQFTEAGIPLIQLLADKFTALNGEAVTTGDVFKLISERAVPFKMVKEVFEDMTNAGGMFYNMQQIQSETLMGVYSNLADAWDVAFNEIGQENMGLIKGLGTGLTELAGSWRTVVNILEPLVIVIGTYNVALSLNNVLSLRAAQTTTLMTLATTRYTAGQTLAAAATYRAATASNVLTRSLWKTYAAILANPFAVWATALAAIAYGIYKIITYESDLDRLISKIGKTSSEAKSGADASIVSLDNLMRKLKDAQRGSQEYANIIAELNKRYSVFLPEQLKVSQSYDQIAESIKGVASAIMERAKAESYAAGISEIEKNYAETLSESYDKAIESLTEKPFAGYDLFVFSKEQADEMWKTALTAVRESPELYKSGEEVGKLIQSTITKGLTDKGVDIKGLDITVANFPQLDAYVKGLKSSADAIVQLNSLSNDFRKKQDIIFGEEALTPYSIALEEINIKYGKLATEIDKKAYSDDKEVISSQRKSDLFDIEKSKLEDLIRVYRLYNQFNLANKSQQQLDKLLDIGTGWQQEVDKIVKANVTLSKFSYGEEEDIFDFADRLKKSHKELLDQQKQIEGGLLAPEFNKKRIAEQLKGVEALGAALKISFAPDKGAEKERKTITKSRIDDLKAELEITEQMYDKYIKLQKSLGKAESKKSALSIFGGLRPEDAAVQLNEMFSQSNVDLLTRPMIDAAELVKKGWEDAGEGIATVFSSQVGISDALGKETEILVTPILPDGTVLSPEELSAYIDGSLSGATDILKADVLGLVIAVDVDPDGKAGEKLHKLQEDFYRLSESSKSAFAFDVKGLQAEYQKTINELRKLGVSEADLVKIKIKMDDVAFAEVERTLKLKLEKMGSDIEKQQLANKFFEKMIGFGADTQLAASLSLNFYGFDPTDVRQKMIDQLQQALGGIALDVTPEGMLDFGKIAERLDLKDYSEEQKKVFMDLLKSIRDNDVEVLTDLYSTLGKYMDFEAKKTEITRKAEEERAKIRRLAPASEQEQLIGLSVAKQKKDLAETTFTEFKDGDMYIKLFENLDRVSTSSLVSIRAQLSKFKDSIGKNLDPTQVKDLIKQFQKVDDEIASRNPFKSFIKGIKDYKNQAISLKQANELAANSFNAYMDATSKLADLEQDRIDALEKGDPVDVINEEIVTTKELVKETKKLAEANAEVADQAQKAKDIIAKSLMSMGDEAQKLGEAINAVKSMLADFGVDAETSEMMATLGDVENWLTGAGKTAEGIGKIVSGDIVGGTVEAVKGVAQWAQGVVGVFTGMNRKVAKANKEIKRQDEILKGLSRSYAELERAMESALGSDYVKDNMEQIKNLQAQQVAYQKQLEAEKSKGKKKDKEKIAEYEQAAIDTQNAILDKQKEVTETMLGSTIKSAATDFASAWLDAYLSFGNTTDAIKDKFKDMMKNMLVQSILAKLIEDRVKKLFADAGEIWNADGTVNLGNLQKVLSQVDSLPDELEKILSGSLDKLNIEGLKDGKVELTGLSRAVGSLSEDTALTLAGIANSGLYYSIGQYNQLLNINAILTRWETSRGAAIIGATDQAGVSSLMAIQNLHLAELQGIKADTANIAISNREILETLLSLTSPLGSRSSSRAINVNI